MPFSASLATAKTWPLKNIAGVCVDSDAFIDLVNEAQRRLIKRGAWFGTEWVVCFTSNGCHITWPRWVKAIYGVRFCQSPPAVLFNNHYSFVYGTMVHGWQSRSIGAGGDDYQLGGGWIGDSKLVDDNMAPCYNEISGNTGKIIQYSVVKNNDYGKTIRLYGTQFGGQPLQEKDANGQWVPGITITAVKPVAYSTVLVTRIDNVVRDQTEGPTYLYELDPNTGLLRELAQYDPTETIPRYRRSRIVNSCGGQKDANGQCIFNFEALVKLQLVEVQSDRDFLLIDDPEALKYAIQAIKAEEGSDNQTGEVFMAKAIRELNMLLREESPSIQIPVNYNVIQGRSIYSAE